MVDGMFVRIDRARIPWHQNFDDCIYRLRTDSNDMTVALWVSLKDNFCAVVRQDNTFLFARPSLHGCVW